MMKRRRIEPYLGERPLEIATEHMKRGVGSCGPRHDEETKTTAGEGLVENRRHPTADHITNHCFSNGLPDRDSDDRRAIAREGISPVNGQGAGRDAPAALSQPVEIGCATQTGIPAH
jgi:hypothetical protein